MTDRTKVGAELARENKWVWGIGRLSSLKREHMESNQMRELLERSQRMESLLQKYGSERSSQNQDVSIQVGCVNEAIR